VANEGYLFNSPLVTMPGEGTAAVPVALSGDDMLADCIKPAEDGNGMIIRLYEPYGTSGTLTITLPEEAVVTETSPLEEPVAEAKICSSFAVEYKPFEIRTFRITSK